jgi:hypothetical protein
MKKGEISQNINCQFIIDAERRVRVMHIHFFYLKKENLVTMKYLTEAHKMKNPLTITINLASMLKVERTLLKLKK